MNERAGSRPGKCLDINSKYSFLNQMRALEDDKWTKKKNVKNQYEVAEPGRPPIGEDESGKVVRTNTNQVSVMWKS